MAELEQPNPEVGPKREERECESNLRGKSELDLESLKKQVTCPLCHKLFKEPKLLPCLDLVCFSCLKEHADEAVSESKDGVRASLEHALKCPRCRSEFSVPNGGVKVYQTSFVTSDLVDLYVALSENKVICSSCQESPAVEFCEVCNAFACNYCNQTHERWPEFSSHKRLPLDQLASQSFGSVLKGAEVLGKSEIACTCSVHVDQKLKLYCETCQELICSDCILVAHKGHVYDTITGKMLEEHKSEMIESLNMLAKLLQFLDESAGSMTTASGHLSGQTSAAKTQIETTFCEIQQGLTARKEELLKEVDEHTRQPVAFLEDYSKHVESLRKQVLSSKDFLQQNLEHHGPTGLLSVERTVLKHVKELEEDVNKMEPVLGEILTLGLKRNEQIEEAISSLGEVVVKVNPAFTTDDRSRALSDSFRRKHSLVFTQSELNLSDELVSTCSESQPPFLHSPQSTLVIEMQKVSGIPVRTIEGVIRPSGITVTDHIAVCEFGTHHVSILDQGGNLLRIIGGKGDRKGYFLYPHSLSVDIDGKMLITDSNYRVQLFNKHGKFMKSVGRKGNKELFFQDPAGIAIGTHSQLFVCERENHRIQVLNRNLSFHSFIGKRGTGPCEFNHPCDVAVDKEEGYLYVVDGYNHRIQVLKEDGTFVTTFGSKGSKPGELNCPSHVCIDPDGYVYVTEIRNSRISSFRCDGTFMKTFGQRGQGLGELIEPRGIAIDQNRVLYVSDFGNNRIHIFK